jgi:hypothetical protein
MKAVIKFEGHELLISQLRETIKLVLEQEAEDQVEDEHESGDVTMIATVEDGPDGTLVVVLEEPESDEE